MISTTGIRMRGRSAPVSAVQDTTYCGDEAAPTASDSEEDALQSKATYIRSHWAEAID